MTYIEKYPHLFNPTEWNWLPGTATFALFDGEGPPDALISNVNLVPYIGSLYGMIDVKDWDWGIPGGTHELDEPYLETARRELMEEMGARIVMHRFFGGWYAQSRAEQPYRPHLPHPRSVRAVAVAQVEVVRAPTGSEKTEQLKKFSFMRLEEAVAEFTAQERHDAAELYQLAAEIRGQT